MVLGNRLRRRGHSGTDGLAAKERELQSGSATSLGRLYSSIAMDK